MGSSSSKPNDFTAGTASTITTIGKPQTTFYDIEEIDADENKVSFKQFQGKVVYGVNIASLCGLTESGYALINELSKLKKNNPDKFEILLFPCNQFMGQEPGTDGEIKEFCMRKGATEAHVFSKGNVNGSNRRPTYKFLKDAGRTSMMKRS
jgi:glutathione peroxidase